MERLIEACQERADDAGYRSRSFRACDIRVIGGSGRSMDVLPSQAASALYRLIHRAPTLVIAFSSILISTDPSRDPPNRRAARPLERFVAYKAMYGLVRGNTSVSPLFEAFEDWLEGENCKGPSDPRVLPFHVFDAGVEGPELGGDSAERRFLEEFGGPKRREDRSDRVWSKGTAHGRQVLQAGGCSLPPGTHWDVAPKRGSARIANMVEIWRVKGKGYVNVYPDEHIRGPRSSRKGHARRVWPRSTKNALHGEGHLKT